MYLSPTVRTMRDDPHPDASVALLVRPADGVAPDDVAAELAAAGADVLGRTRFDAVRIQLLETELDAALAVDGVAAVETTDVTRHDADATGAGEDVEFDG